jgi:hypothetical protein
MTSQIISQKIDERITNFWGFLVTNFWGFLLEFSRQRPLNNLLKVLKGVGTGQRNGVDQKSRRTPHTHDLSQANIIVQGEAIREIC